MMAGYLTMCCTTPFLIRHVRHDVLKEVTRKHANYATLKRRQVDPPDHRPEENTILLIPKHIGFDIARQLERQQVEIARRYPRRQDRRGLSVTIDLAKTPISYHVAVQGGRKARDGVLTSLRVVVIEDQEAGHGLCEGAQGPVRELRYKINHADVDQFE